MQLYSEYKAILVPPPGPNLIMNLVVLVMITNRWLQERERSRELCKYKKKQLHSVYRGHLLEDVQFCLFLSFFSFSSPVDESVDIPKKKKDKASFLASYIHVRQVYTGYRSLDNYQMNSDHDNIVVGYIIASKKNVIKEL